MFVSVVRDATALTVEYDFTSDDIYDSVTQFLTSGDTIRIGGVDKADGLGGQTAIDGAVRLSSVGVVSGSPIVDVHDSSAIVLPFEEIRLGADNYTALKTGIEVQVFTIDCGSTDPADACGNYGLTLNVNGAEAATGCVQRIAGKNMTTAAEMMALFDAMDNLLPDDVYVTLTQTPDDLLYTYSVYFQGETVRGANVAEMIIVDGSVGGVCNVVPEGTGVAASIMEVAQGGASAIQSVRVNVEAGYVSGEMFKLACGAEVTPDFIEYGAEASVVGDALSALECFSDQSMPFTATVSAASTTVTASSTVYGFISKGDVLRIDGNCCFSHQQSCLRGRCCPWRCDCWRCVPGTCGCCCC